ncbi:substrate-binding periplasmic protein [Zooshikella harenae]|uniref:Transporter substrate-binding domain-containing protein n=1 Tax=Zooshikella harenae TaxID=2827238 RepID=A0ABS5Z9L5_9GAMM|nr:transporter substrate-binding domain-containing protein [Zooshikella harenae]MBU2710737.1 transporter substrate-binding domain-containing protein [Zooshikella harenae]
MSKLLLVIKRVWLWGILLAMVSHANAKEINYVVIADQARPFQIENNGHDHSGIITEIVQNIFSGDEWQLKIHTFPYKRMISMLESGRIKHWITYGSPEWKSVRVQSENLSKYPLVTVKHSLLSYQQPGFKFTKIEDLYGKTVIALLGFLYPGLDPYVENKKVNVMWVKGYEPAFRVLKRLKDDAFILEMAFRLKYNLKKNKEPFDQFQFHDFSLIIPDYQVYFAYSSDMDRETVSFMNKRLKAMHDSKAIEAIVAHYD